MLCLSAQCAAWASGVFRGTLPPVKLPTGGNMSAQALKGKTIVITGANSGIGLVAAESLAGMGAHVVLACRRQQAADEAMQQIRRAHPAASLEFVHIDLASLASVRQAAAELSQRHARIDVLINNAGLACVGRQLSEDGLEMTFAVNHLGPFLLTNLLLPNLKLGKGRVITVASGAHKAGKMHWDDLQLEKGYFVMKAYAQSKLANILFTRALSRRCSGMGIHANCLHPGGVATNIWPDANWAQRAFSALLKKFLISPEEGARTTIWLASNETGGRATGKYFVRCKERAPSAEAQDDAAAERLWQISEKLSALK